MQLPLYRAKDIDSDKWYEGFYFEYPSTTYCFTEDYIKGVEMIHCLATYRSTDWGLPNIPIYVTIDISTIEKIGNVDVGDEKYYGERKIHKVF